jgi:tetratricopeptide (TPR) repeat protein
MLEHEQHILPVDLLFDDDQIGDYVKSIQIDSPYQQMLLEGVLTESVRDEKLYVSFTVEGYFHFVLGEVIQIRNERFGAESLIQIVEENKLNGVKEGVEQFLIRDVQKDDLSRLTWLINLGGAFLNLCIAPLANAFLKLNGNPKTDDELRLAHQIQIRKVLENLLIGFTDNDVIVLEKSLNYLHRKQKKQALSIAYHYVSNLIQPNTLKKALLYLRSLRFVSESELPSKIRTLESLSFEDNKSKNYSSFLELLGGIYCSKNVADYNKAIPFFHQALEINLKQKPKSFLSISVNYNELGIVYMLNEEFDKSIEYYSKSLNIQIENKHEDISSILECFGIVELRRKNFDKALDYFVRTLKIKEINLGCYHSNVASTLSVIALTHTKIGDSLNAVKYWFRTLEIEERLNKYDKQKIAIIHKNIGDEYYRMRNFKLAISHLLIFRNYLRTMGEIDSTMKIVTEKILKCYNSIGLEKYKSFNYSESVIAYNNALNVMNESKINVLKMDHIIYFNLGNAYLKYGQSKKAKFYLDLALKIRILSIEDNPALVGKTYNSLGNVELSEGNYKSAKELYQKALSIFQSTLGLEHEHTKLLSKKINNL